MRIMIFKPNKYGIYTKDEFTLVCEEAENYFMSDQWHAPTAHQGGMEELGSKIGNAIKSGKEKAAKAAGLKDGFTIKSVINGFKSMLGKLIDKIKSLGQTILPQAKNFLNKLCNYIMDAIDYVKHELS